VLAPAVLRLDSREFTPGSGPLQQAPYTTNPTLADGGVYDNLGLETCFKRYKTLFVSNASAPFAPEPSISRNCASVGARCISVMDNQVLSQRKRLLVEAFKSRVRAGAFWDIQQDVSAYPCSDKLPCPVARTEELARVATDLERKDSALQERLINWGYAVSDAAVRTWFNVLYPAPAAFPYPGRGV
jgi:NTE family protein